MQISILGCGWLGLPLAKALIAAGHTIKGSTTTEAKLRLLYQEGVEPFIVSLTEKEPAGDITGFFEGSDTLIINVPPKVKGGESYADKIKCLIPFIGKAAIKKVLFVSSTSVYADDDSVVTEEILPGPETESGQQVLEAEKVVQGDSSFTTTILRFGGLIGEDRHPVYHLAGRQNVANPNAPVNLIHRNDCIGIIKTILEKEAWGTTFNGVAPYHPARKDYYTIKAEELGLAEPKFGHSESYGGKTISSSKIQKELNYIFTSPI